MLDFLRILIYLTMAVSFAVLAWSAWHRGQFGHNDDWESPTTRAQHPIKFYAFLAMHVAIAITCLGLATLEHLDRRSSSSSSTTSTCAKP